jgi:hypothetical protein
MYMDGEPDPLAWPGLARRAMQLAAGIVYARVRGAEADEIAALCTTAVDELAASGAGENAQVCLLTGLITVGADVMLIAATAINKNPDKLVAELQETYGSR